MSQNQTPAHPADTATLRLTMEVTYSLNGESVTEMVVNLRKLAEIGMGEGLLTGETAAEVDSHTIEVEVVEGL